MSSGSYRQVNVKCPFYRSDDGRGKIICEGLKERSTVSLNYRRKQDYEKHIRGLCSGEYKQCPVHGMLMEKYEEKNHGKNDL